MKNLSYSSECTHALKAASRPAAQARKHQAGLSLIDVMVGLVLGLIATIIIFQMFENSERVKRTSTSGGDAEQAGIAATFALERGLRLAGYGLNANDALLAAPPVPLTITPGAVAGVPAAAQPDSLTITYRPSSSADCPASTAPNCYWEYGSFAPPTAAGFGTAPNFTTLNYCVMPLTGQLVSRTVPCTNPAGHGDDVILAEGIAQLKAVRVNDGGGRMTGVQLIIVARSSQPEKNVDAANVCNTTTVGPSWINGTVDLSGLIGLTGDDWKCYRYKAFTVTVPLRNVIWS